jgi:hypothetical protein
MVTPSSTMRTLAWLLCCSVLAFAAAGCGGGSGGNALKQAQKKVCETPKQVKALARLNVDLASIKAASKLPVKDTLKGNDAINKATDRFLLHVETAPLDNLVRNRLIDHAAAFLVGQCEQCFQALEAARPIPGIAHAHNGVACSTG